MPKDEYLGPDPDPTEYLYVTPEIKRQDQAKPYDGKKSCWVPHEKHGFVVGEIKSASGDTVTVTVNQKVLLQSNPHKMFVADF